MTQKNRTPIDDASAWTGKELEASDDWIWHLDEHDIAEFDAALASAKRLNRPWQETIAGDFPLPRLADRLKETARRLEHGRGVTLIRGMPIDLYELDDLKRLYLGLGSHMGAPICEPRPR